MSAIKSAATQSSSRSSIRELRILLRNLDRHLSFVHNIHALARMKTHSNTIRTDKTGRLLLQISVNYTFYLQQETVNVLHRVLYASNRAVVSQLAALFQLPFAFFPLPLPLSPFPSPSFRFSPLLPQRIPPQIPSHSRILLHCMLAKRSINICVCGII